MTYLELRDLLNSLTAQQLMQDVHVYSGDIDDAIRVVGTSENSNAEMGESICGFSATQTFLILA